MRLLTTLTLAGVLTLTACGDDDDAATGPTSSVTAPSTTAVDTTVAAAVDTTVAAARGYLAGADPDADAVALAWTSAFDSSTGFDAKAAFIADAEALRPTIEAYTPAGEAVGGIALVPTDIVVTGDTATVTYDVTFAGQPAYQDQEGSLERVDGAWVVSRDEFCSFMAAARNPCA